MIEVGKINRVVEFKKNTPAAKGAGGSDSYSTLLTTRGSLEKLNGSREFGFGELTENASYVMFTRYQTALASNLRMDMKVVIDSRTFTISSWEKVGEKKFYYRFVLNEEKN